VSETAASCLDRTSSKVVPDKSLVYLITDQEKREEILMEEAVEAFLSSAPSDKELRDKLLKHLALLKEEKLIRIWYEDEISAGTDRQQAIDEHLNTALLILLLISSDFFASERHRREMQRAIERSDAKEARVIPIILRPIDWQNVPLSKLQPLPPNGKPVTTWSSQDTALYFVAQGIRKAVEELRSQAGVPEGLTARVIAERVIIFLEDRRILYVP